MQVYSTPTTGIPVVQNGNIPETMTSLEIADLLEKRHDSVKRAMERLSWKNVIQLPPLVEVKNHLGQTVEVYEVGERDSYVVVAQLSPEFTARLVDYWQEHKSQQRPMTTAEMFLQSANVLYAIEQRQAAQAVEIQTIGAKVDKVEQAQTVMSSRPTDAESITHIRKRINKLFGLSAGTVDAVIRQSPYSPKPAGTVKNSHEEADGATFVVFWRKDITALFKRFVSECLQVTPTMCTHPYIDGRFRLVKGGAA